jgi:histone arginine demethylase JMJD6
VCNGTKRCRFSLYQNDFFVFVSYFGIVLGAKRWVLFPYGTDKSKIGMQDPQIPSALWFASNWYRDAIEQVPGAIEILQQPGETVYVPCGWPHLVLNLEFSTAITHNYATEFPSFERIRQSVQEEEPVMAPIWVAKLKQVRPELLSEQAYGKDDNRTFGDDGMIISLNPSHTSSAVRCTPQGKKFSSTAPVSLMHY